MPGPSKLGAGTAGRGGFTSFGAGILRDRERERVRDGLDPGESCGLPRGPGTRSFRRRVRPFERLRVRDREPENTTLYRCVMRDEPAAGSTPGAFAPAGEHADQQLRPAAGSTRPPTMERNGAVDR